MYRRVTFRFISNVCTRQRLCCALAAFTAFAGSRLAVGPGPKDVAASASAPLLARPTRTTPGAQEVTALEPGKPTERELTGGQEHSYQLTLAEGQYASVVVEQRGIDVVVQLLGPDGKPAADFDSEGRSVGEEKIEVVAETAGTYRLRVKAKYPKLLAGRYEIRLIELRGATEEDRLLYEARRLFAASTRLVDAGKYTEALAPGEKALELQERRWGTGHPELAAPLLNLAAISYYRGDYAKGEAFSQRGLQLTEKTLGAEHLMVARLLSNLALFYQAKGDDARAEAPHQRALSIREKALGPEHPLVTFSLSSLGVIYRTRGDFVRAEQFLQRALTAQEKVLGGEHTSFASTLNNLAGLYREKGDYAKAEPLYQRALMIYEKTNHPFVTTALNNLANLYRDLGDYEKAEPLYKRSIAIKEKLVGPEHPDVANSLSNLGFIYLARGDYAKAETTYLSALATMEKARGPNHYEVGWDLSYLADLHFAMKDYAKAEPLYQRARSILEATRGTNYYHLADIFVNLAAMAMAEEKLEQALAYQARANDITEYNLALNFTIGSERQKLAYLAKLPTQMNRAISLHVRFAVNDGKAREMAAATVVQSKGRVQDALSHSLASLRSRSSAEDQALLDQLNDNTSQLARLALNGPQGTSLAEHLKQIKTLEERREKLESEIGSRSAGFYERSQAVTLAAIRTAIPDNAALIELVVYRPFDPKAKGTQTYGEPRYVAYVMRKQGEVQWKGLGEAKTIDEAIEAWRQALRDPQRRDVQQLARALDEKIMRPLRPLLGDATHLLISPDGALNLIPFEALLDEQNHYLLERFACTYLTSGRDLLRLQVKRASKSPPLVLANPLFGEPELLALARSTTPPAPRAASARKQPGATKRQSVTSGSDLSSVYFAPLAGTAQEAQSIKALFAEAKVLTGPQATESALKLMAAPHIIHIATHGFFLSGAPQPSSSASGETTRSISANLKVENPLLRSGLALAGANLRKNGGDDGILTALEASGLNLWGTKLVTLSACDTGVGEVRNGEGVYGLRRALVLAGAETLVMSLWPVSDYVTRELMTAYYQGLKQGQGRGAALREVQLSMLKRKGREHPFYWASFIQSGEWANLEGRR